MLARWAGTGCSIRVTSSQHKDDTFGRSATVFDPLVTDFCLCVDVFRHALMLVDR